MKKHLLLFVLMLMPLLTKAQMEINGIYYILSSTNKVAEVTSGVTQYTGSVVIPPTVIYEGVTYSVKSIGNDAFLNCSDLTSVIIPNGVTSIRSRAFEYCSNLTSVNIPNSVTIINECAFLGCKGLSFISIGSGVNTIDSKAFAYCSGLKDIYCYAVNIPAITRDTFEETNSLKWGTLYVPEELVDLYKKSAWNLFGAIEPLANGIQFSDNVIETLCLSNWDTNKDKRLDMDEAAVVTDLSSVFTNNTDITSFDELQYFTGLTSIGEQAFYNCSNLKSIIIPENVTTIGNSAFYNCSGLETIEVDENNQYYDSRNSCNALIQTSSNTLLVGCKNSVIPDGVTSIAEGAFRGCTELTKIVIPEGVNTIGASAFRGCTGLTSVSLPSTITSIGNYAFSAFDEVYNLTTVSVGMTSPVAIASEVFPNRAYSILYVPKGSRPAYKAVNYWKEFKQIIELEDGVPVKCEKPTITFFASGKIKVESATEGAKCITNITASNVEPLTDGDVSLNTPLTIYTVKAYATAEGYADSDEATATFRYEKTNGDMNGDGTVNIADVVQLVNMILGN